MAMTIQIIPNCKRLYLIPNCKRLYLIFGHFNSLLYGKQIALDFKWESMNEVKRIVIVCENNEVTHFGRNPQYYSTNCST